MDNDKKKVAVYTRVSTDTALQLKSSDNQQSYFEREIGKSDEYELYQIYADEGVSGTKLSRPEFDRMLFDAGLDIKEIRNNDDDDRKEYTKYVTVRSSSRKPKFDLVITKNTSRFARNVVVEDILRDLRNNQVYVRFLDLNKSTENKEDITYIQIFQSFDERESRDKSTKVKFGNNEGAQKGIIRTNGKLYGYEYIQKENRLEIRPNEADTVRNIFELYSNGYGIRRLSNELTVRGIFNRKGKQWGKTSLLRILNNEKYFGVNNSLKYDTGEIFNKNSYPKVKDEYELRATDKIPPIINKELFVKCQDILKRKVASSTRKGVYTGNTKYAGKIYCHSCGKPYYANKDNGRPFYVCKTKKEKGLSECKNVNISEKLFVEFIENKRKNYRRVKEDNKQYLLDMVYLQKFYLIEQLDVDNSEKIAMLKKEIKRLEENITNLLIAVSKGGAVEKIALQQLDKINAEIDKINYELGELSVTNSDILIKIELLEALEKNLLEQKIKDEYSFDEVLSENIFLIIKETNSLRIKKSKVRILMKSNIENEINKLIIVDEKIMDAIDKSKLYWNRVEDSDRTVLLMPRKDEFEAKLKEVRRNLR